MLLKIFSTSVLLGIIDTHCSSSSKHLIMLVHRWAEFNLPVRVPVYGLSHMSEVHVVADDYGGVPLSMVWLQCVTCTINRD